MISRLILPYRSQNNVLIERWREAISCGDPLQGGRKNIIYDIQDPQEDELHLTPSTFQEHKHFPSSGKKKRSADITFYNK